MTTRRILTLVSLALGVSLIPFLIVSLSAALSSNAGKMDCDEAGRCTQVEIADQVRNGNSIIAIRDPDIEPGFPVQALHYGGTYASGQGILTLVGNIDSDPELEIIATGLARGPLYAWNPNGSVVAGWPITATYYAGYPGLGKLSHGSTAKDIFVGYFYNGQAFIYSGNGVAFAGWPQTLTLPSRPPTLVDINDDGLDEIFLGEGSGMYRLFAYKPDGSQLPGWPIEGPTETPAIADLDGDGDLEIVTATSYPPSLHVYHQDGTPVTGFPLTFSGYVETYPAVGDVDGGDGEPEIIVVGAGPGGILIVSSNGVIEHALTASGETFYGSAPALADLDGDSIPEIIVQTNTALNVWRGDGSFFPGWPVDWESYYWIGNSSPVVGDVNGDQQPDIVVVSHVGGQGVTGLVRAYNRNGQPLARFPKEINIGAGAVPAIADIDLDGRNEIIITGAYWDGIAGDFDKVWVYDLGGGPHGRIEWGQMGGNAQHRGLYPPPPDTRGVDLHIDVARIVPAAPGGLATASIHYANLGETRAISITLVMTFDSQLIYTSDTSGVAPEVSGTIITWTLPSATYYQKNGFNVYLQVPLEAGYGMRYPITGTLTSANPDVDYSDNNFSSEVMITRQVFLPVIVKQSK